MNSRSPSCYCCKERSNAMDVDAALDELGMLSTVTNSRRQYLRERVRTRSETIHSETKSLNIVQLDKNFVSSISSGTFGTFYPTVDPGENIVVDPNSPGSSNMDQYRDTPTLRNREKQKCIRRSLLRKNRYKKPYEVPWRLSTSLPETTITYDETTSGSLTPGLSKSNSESPIKGVRANDNLTRSRSLENIELARTKLLEIFEKVPDIHEKQELERVSNNLANMKVDDTYR